MYEGQITVLLGHNGAGKTTTMSILTGMRTPTRGQAIINGFDVTDHIYGARQSLGLCPQSNVLFDDLTVHEHIYFFSKLKGMENYLVDDEIMRFVLMLQLEPKEHCLSKTLSGGMKRKLNTGIALCGNSKVVLLDEPTSGMDPAARRAIWDILLLEKEGRTLLLSTHFMDEADVLGDRIAIMADGKLQCCGSPYFLKKSYGGGYRIIIEKGPNSETEEITELLSNYISGITPSQDVGSELSYQVDEVYCNSLETILCDLEVSKTRLDVQSYGVALTTMEEVFLCTGRDKGVSKHVRGSVDKKNIPGSGDIEVVIPEEEDFREELVEGNKLECYRIEALIMKKYIVYREGWLILLLHCLFPIIFISSILIIDLQITTQITQGEHVIDLKTYNQKIITIALSDRAQEDDFRAILARVFYKSYRRHVAENGGTVNDLPYGNAVPIFITEILDELRNDLKTTRHDYLAGTTILPQQITAWFNDYPLHTAPLSISLAVNALLRNYDSGIIFINHPLPLSPETEAKMKAFFSNASRIAHMIAMAMAFIAAYFVMFVIRERVCKNKHLQFVSGVHPVMFWGVHLATDGIIFLIPCFLTVFTLMAFHQEGYNTVGDWGRIFLILVLFGWAVLPYMYCASFLFDVPATGYGTMAIINLFTGTAAFLVVSLFRLLRIAKTEIDILEWMFYYTPHYCLAHAIQNNYLNHIHLGLCASIQDYCISVESNPCCPGKCPSEGCFMFSNNYFALKDPGFGKNLIVFSVLGIVFICILLLIEYEVFRKCWNSMLRKKLQKKRKKQRDGRDNSEDFDVYTEKEKIHKSNLQDLCEEYILVLKDVTKYYGSFLAVDHTCVGVKKGQCFGLLGSNGAGKTTTFQMMTGDLMMTKGEIYVEGLNLRQSKKLVQQKMGYCPQFDALLLEMTGWETLRMFCLIRGIPKRSITNVSVKLADLLLITKHMSKQCGRYSGGNKRKLSTAIALIGSPSIVFLDEPTTGMDPVARRHLWNVICNVRDSGVSVVLTSHSMEECEALCTKVAIQVNGSFKCLGSLQHLKNKFAKGFSLQVKVTPPSSQTSFPPTERRDSIALMAVSLDPVKRYIKFNFPGAVLEDEYMGVLSYTVPQTNLQWPQMFGIMDKAKSMYDIEDYSIGQTSLEQVFLGFTKEQTTVDY